MPCKLVPDITVGPVGAAELDHQPQLINFPHRGKDRHQLILKAVPDQTAVKFERFNKSAGTLESCSSRSQCPCLVATQSSLAAVPRKCADPASARSRTLSPPAVPAAA